MEETKDLVKVNETRSWEDAIEKESWIAPMVDIYETSDDYNLVANMPGVTKENVKIKVEEESLIIMGRTDFLAEISKKYIVKEIDSSNYYIKFKLADSVNSDKIDAKMENGRLYVTLPKLERVKPRTIEIK
ncbi:MAG: heat-shock protein Hsp20 [Ignavibacteriae bacterium]|nr:MAG: heat-shock protein Hsp20 [Ignavibacteriota bacterium]